MISSRPLSRKELAKKLREKGGICGVHCENSGVIDALIAEHHRGASAAVKVIGHFAALLNEHLLKLLQGHALVAPAVAALGGHAPDDVDEGVQPGADGLQAAEARVELLHGRVLAAAAAEVAEQGGFEAVGRVGEHQGVGGALAVFHQEGLGQQRDEAALAVGDDVDRILRVVVVDHANQRRQPLGGQHEVHAPGALEDGAERVAAEPVDEAAEGGRARLPHVGQVGGGVGEGAAALAEILVEAVVSLVHPLPVAAAGTLVGGDPVAPVEGDHRAVGGGADVAPEEHRVRVVLEAAAVVVGRHAVAGGRVGGGMVGPARAPRHALGDALAEAFLDGLEAHPDVVDPMHDDAGPHVFAGDVDEPGQRTGAEHGAALGDDLWRLGVVLHGAARGGRRCRSGYCLIIHVRAWWGVVNAMKNYGVAMGWGVGGRSSPVGPGVLRALGVAASCAVCGCVRRG